MGVLGHGSPDGSSGGTARVTTSRFSTADWAPTIRLLPQLEAGCRVHGE